MGTQNCSPEVLEASDGQWGVEMLKEEVTNPLVQSSLSLEAYIRWCFSEHQPWRCTWEKMTSLALMEVFPCFVMLGIEPRGALTPEIYPQPTLLLGIYLRSSKLGHF